MSDDRILPVGVNLWDVKPPPPRATEYMVIEDVDSHDFGVGVTTAIDNGWSLYGFLVVRRGRLYQAMTR